MKTGMIKALSMIVSGLICANAGGGQNANTLAKAENTQKEFKSLGEILRLLPNEMQPHKEPWKKNPLLDFNKWFKENIVGARLTLQNQQLLKISGHSIAVNCDSLKIGSIDYRTANGVNVKFGDDWEKVTASLVKMKVAQVARDGRISQQGTSVTVTGIIKEISAQPCMNDRPPIVLMHVTLGDPQLAGK